jgi:hypothetical protein
MSDRDLLTRTGPNHNIIDNKSFENYRVHGLQNDNKYIEIVFNVA